MHIHNPPMEIEDESDRFTTVICQSELERVMLEGAGRLLIAALDLEAARYVEHFERLRDELGHRVAVRNGYTEPRTLQSGLGTLKVRAPWVNDRRESERITSQILPPCLRRTPTLESLIPILYLDVTFGRHRAISAA